jgi:hypothetical protein
VPAVLIMEFKFVSKSAEQKSYYCERTVSFILVVYICCTESLLALSVYEHIHPLNQLNIFPYWGFLPLRTMKPYSTLNKVRWLSDRPWPAEGTMKQDITKHLVKGRGRVGGRVHAWGSGCAAWIHVNNTVTSSQ